MFAVLSAVALAVGIIGTAAVYQNGKDEASGVKAAEPVVTVEQVRPAGEDTGHAK